MRVAEKAGPNTLSEARACISALSADQGVHYVLDGQRLARLAPVAIENVVKKCVLYADKTIIFMPSLTLVENLPSGFYWQVGMWGPYADGPEVYAEVAAMKQIRDALDPIAEASADSEDVLFLPKSIPLIGRGHDGSGREVDDPAIGGNDLSGDYDAEFSFAVDTEIPQFSGPTPGQNTELSRLDNIWLPTLCGIELNQLLTLRADEKDSFLRLRYAIRSFVTKLPECSDRRAVIEVAEMLDNEIRSFNAKITGIRARYRVALAEVALGSAALGLCAIVPSDVSKIISGFLGASQLTGAISRCFGTKEQFNDLRLSEFFIAWRLHRRFG